MTQEDKDLLFRDLCARIPYNVKCYNSKYRPDLAEEIICITVNYNHHCVQLGTYLYKLEQVKPYLFPLSSMTKEQEKELKYLCDWENDRWSGLVVIQESKFCMNTEIIDWLNKNHFDYRGLIEKGLAIDATGLNIY